MGEMAAGSGCCEKAYVAMSVFVGIFAQFLVVLQECVEPLGLTITEAAEALGVTSNTLSELVNGKRGISPEMAVRLSTVFGGTEQGWLVQQAQYNLAHVRRDRIKLKRLQLA